MSQRVVSSGERTYALGVVLGRGLQGKVRVARCLETGQEVAIKYIKRDSLIDGRVLKNLQRETAALELAGTHPHVIDVLNINWDCAFPRRGGGEKRVVLIVMELCEGGELFDFLVHTGAFNEACAKVYMQQLCEALHHCHSRNISHRDLKPENLLLTADCRLKVADFGLCARSTDGELNRSQVGTWGYMAPEVVAGRPYDGRAADCWSVGVLLFTLLAGYPPLRKAQRGDWWFECLERGDKASFWEWHSNNGAILSAAAKGVLDGLLEVNPDRRMTIAAARSSAFTAAAAGLTAPLAADMARRLAEVRVRVTARRKEDEAEEDERKEASADTSGTLSEASSGHDPFRIGPAMRSVPSNADGWALRLPACPVHLPSATRATWFFTDLPVDRDYAAIALDVVKAIEDVAPAATPAVNRETYTIKTPLGGARAVIKLYEAKGKVLVDFMRAGGDGMDFLSAFKQLCKELAHRGAPSPTSMPSLAPVPLTVTDPAAVAASPVAAPPATDTRRPSGSVTDSVTML